MDTSIGKAVGTLVGAVVAAVAISNAAASDQEANRVEPPMSHPRKHQASAGDVSWPQEGPVLNQGKTGACTGFAVAGLLGRSGADAMRIYTLATRLDGYPGEYPSRDTGSSVDAAMAAARELGYIKRFKVVTTASGTLKALRRHPLAVSLQDWPIRGKGHTMILLAHSGDTLHFQNSWGPGYGDHGMFELSVSAFKKDFVASAYVE